MGKGRDMRSMLNGTSMTKVARIDTGLCFEPGFEQKVDGFAREFGLQRIELPGGTAGEQRAAWQQPGPGARISSFNCKGWLEPIRAICRMTRKKFLGE